MDASTQENVVLSQNQSILPEQPKQNNFLVIFLSILLLISVGVAGFFAYQTQKLVAEVTLLKSTTNPILNSEPTFDLTADWKIYTNEKIGFTLKYPDTWTELNGNLSTKNKCNSIVITSQYYDSNLSEFLAKEYNDPEYKITMTPKITTIDGNEAQMFGSLGIGEVQNIYIKNGSRIIIIREIASVPEGGDPEGYWEKNCKNFNAQTDQILSTFKFTDLGSSSVAEEKQKIELAAKMAFVKKTGQEPTTKYGLSDESFKVIGDWAFGIITVAPVNESAGPGANYFIARKINNVWEAKIEYTDEFRDWLKISPDGLVSIDLKQFLQ